MTDREEVLVEGYINSHIPGVDGHPGVSLDERAVIDAMLGVVAGQFRARKFILGLAIDFTVLAERVSGGGANDEYEPNLTAKNVLDRHGFVESDDEATLTLVGAGGRSHGIRPVEEELITFFHTDLRRSSYPSSGPHVTGQWKRFQELLALAFRLSKRGRALALCRLFEYGLSNMSVNEAYLGTPRPRTFESIVTDYPRGAGFGENGGLVFQGIVYGFLKADRPHLDLIVGKVRAGSKREKRIGDIDGYDGPFVSFTCEVKDMRIDQNNIDRQLGSFVEAVRTDGLMGIVAALEVEASTYVKLEDAGVLVLDQGGILEAVRLWDWAKQDAALMSLLHYLAHVEQKPSAVQRLLTFVENIDPDHPALAAWTRPDADLQGELGLT